LNWEAIGAIAELLGALGVIATLGYLAVQIRQNTRTIRTSTYQSALDSSNRVNELILANPHLERIFRLGRLDLSQLTDEERPQFRMLIAQFLSVHETMFLQYERGTLDEDFWRSRLAGLRSLLTQPGIHEALAPGHRRRRQGRGRSGRVDAFMELVDSILEEGPGPAA